jgi:hypothetical protein
MITEKIYCCGCLKDVDAELTSGQGVYPTCKENLQVELWQLPFWRCPTCKNFVGCHHKSSDPTRPLGCIPTSEIKNARQHIHKLIDPLWKAYKEPFRARAWIYRWLAAKMGKEKYHTAEIRSVEEAREIYKHALTIKNVEDCRNDA